MMILYETPVAKLPVMGCKECPNSAKLSHSPYSISICKALTIEQSRETDEGEQILSNTIYFNINEYVKEWGFHPNCPLPEYER